MENAWGIAFITIPLQTYMAVYIWWKWVLHRLPCGSPRFTGWCGVMRIATVICKCGNYHILVSGMTNVTWIVVSVCKTFYGNLSIDYRSYHDRWPFQMNINSIYAKNQPKSWEVDWIQLCQFVAKILSCQLFTWFYPIIAVDWHEK
jgi:hypothetical protein